MVPDEPHQKNTYQNCHFGPIFVALLIHACAAVFVVGTFVTLRPFGCFFWRVSPGGPLGSPGVPLGVPLGLFAASGGTPPRPDCPISGALPGMCLFSTSFLLQMAISGPGRPPGQISQGLYLPGRARPQQNIRIFALLNEQQLN